MRDNRDNGTRRAWGIAAAHNRKGVWVVLFVIGAAVLFRNTPLCVEAAASKTSKSAITASNISSKKDPEPDREEASGVWYGAKKEMIKDGWLRENGKTRYYVFNPYKKTSSPVRGLQTIDGYRFYFSKSGVLQTGWREIGGKKYYFKKKGKLGILGRAATGKAKIAKKWRIFDRKGVLRTKNFKEDKITYHVKEGILEAYEKSSSFYFPNGKRMKDAQEQDYVTFCRAREIAAEITTASMSKEEKRLACFKWVIRHPYVIHRKFKPVDTWPSTYANDHFVRGCGDCHADGCAFAYLARAIGYKEVYVCLDCNGTVPGSHCWAEIDGKVYDPLFAEAKSFERNYNSRYGVYKLSPVLHIKVAANWN